MNERMLQSFLMFVEERHAVWERRQSRAPRPWSDNPILKSKKFTNVYRVLDPGSQFVFDLMDEDPRETLARIVLYRHTNAPGAWRAFRGDYGRYPHLQDMANGTLEAFWDLYRDAGYRVFSGAYTVFPQSSTPGTDKVRSVIDLTKRLFYRLEDQGSPGYIWDRFRQADSLEEQFNVLRSVNGLASFMSMQILTDWGYTPHCGLDRENEFVAAGPGSTRGAQAIYPGRDPVASIIELHSILSERDTGPVLATMVGWRRPSLMDVQNCCCEFSKYLRWVQKWDGGWKSYVPAYQGEPIPPKLPAHWN